MEPCDLPPLADVVLRVADVCAKLAVPYAIGGAVATSFWGVPRTTQDADCLIAVPAVAYQRLADALSQEAGPMSIAAGGTISSWKAPPRSRAGLKLAQRRPPHE